MSFTIARLSQDDAARDLRLAACGQLIVQLHTRQAVRGLNGRIVHDHARAVQVKKDYGPVRDRLESWKVRRLEGYDARTFKPSTF